MRNLLLAGACISLGLLACSKNPYLSHNDSIPKVTHAMMDTDNPFAKQSTLDYFTPDFSKISVTDYEPAFAVGMAQHADQINAIAINPEPVSLENTLVAMENSGALFNRVQAVFFNMAALISDAEYQRIESDLAPKLTEHWANIYLNANLFARVETLYKQRDQYDGEDKRLVEVYYDQFIRAGAQLSPESQLRLREINAKLASLTTEFSQNILKSFKNDTILVADKTELDGLSDDEIASLKSAAEEADQEGYMITLVNTTRQPILSGLKNRTLREKIWRTSAQRAHASNDAIIIEQATLRAEVAALLGYKTWADYKLADQMAKSPQPVLKMLSDMAPKVLSKTKAEAADIEALIDKSGKSFELQPWDWAYYAEQVRAAKFDLDADLVKPYFELNRVLNDGLFYAMNRLYGITFNVRNDLPVWHEDVMAWEVFNEDGSSVGLFYLDPYAREGKSGGAWMSSYVDQNHLREEKPVVYNSMNIPKPAAGLPTLMTFDEVNTLFHEFGHADHGLFSNVKYPSLSGTAVPRDFVEFPSQYNEDWDINPEVLGHYAKHYETGEPIPQQLLEKLLAAHTFNQGFDTLEYLASALLDMEWHTIEAGQSIADVDEYEQAALAKYNLDYNPVPPRYKSAYFSHVFGGGYSAGYYAYLWSEVLAADAFEYQNSESGLTRESGQTYREAILSIGNSKDLLQSYEDYRGQEAGVDALLRRRGLL